MSKAEPFHTPADWNSQRNTLRFLARRLFREWRPHNTRILLNCETWGDFQSLICTLHFFLIWASIRIISLVQIKRQGRKKRWCWLRAHCRFSLHSWQNPHKKASTSEGRQDCVSTRFQGRFRNHASHLWEDVGPRLHNLPGIFRQKSIPVPGWRVLWGDRVGTYVFWVSGGGT